MLIVPGAQTRTAYANQRDGLLCTGKLRLPSTSPRLSGAGSILARKPLRHVVAERRFVLEHKFDAGLRVRIPRRPAELVNPSASLSSLTIESSLCDRHSAKCRRYSRKRPTKGRGGGDRKNSFSVPIGHTRGSHEGCDRRRLCPTISSSFSASTRCHWSRNPMSDCERRPISSS